MGRARSAPEEDVRAREAPASGLADALLTSTQQRVLSLLFGQPDRSFIQQELIDLAGSGSGAVRRELARLVESGLVTCTRIGTQKHYRANRSAPIFDELHGIVVKTVGLVDPLHAVLRPLAKRIDVALVYGSVAKGADRADSDIDLFLVGDGLTLEEIFRRLAPVEKKLGRKINPTLYARDEYARRRSAGNPFLKKILGGETILLMGSVDGRGDSSRDTTGRVRGAGDMECGGEPPHSIGAARVARLGPPTEAR
jgi:predicted nucleotidyltransferase